MKDAVTDAINGVYDKLAFWLKYLILMLPNLLVATIIFVVFYALGSLVRRLLTKPLHRVFHSGAIANLILNIMFGVFVIVGIFIGLGILKLDKAVTSLLAGAGIVGLALGFAFQDIASNFVSGVLLAIRKPFKPNDIIESNGYMGVVMELNLRTVILRTFQGQHISIPNKDIYSKPILNYSVEGKRRVDLQCGVSYGADLERVEKIAIEAIRSIDYIDRENIIFSYRKFSGSSIDFEISYWAPFRKQPDYLRALNDGIIRLKKAFDANDIQIPFPTTTLDFGVRGGQHLWEDLVKLKPFRDGAKDQQDSPDQQTPEPQA